MIARSSSGVGGAAWTAVGMEDLRSGLPDIENHRPQAMGIVAVMVLAPLPTERRPLCQGYCTRLVGLRRSLVRALRPVTEGGVCVHGSNDGRTRKCRVAAR